MLGFDPYAYVQGNPETKNDPTGHWGWGDLVAAAVVAVVVAAVVIAAPVVVPVLIAAAADAVATTAATVSVAAAAGVAAAADGAGAVGIASAVATTGYVASVLGPDAMAVADDGAAALDDTAAALDDASAGCGDGLSFKSNTPVATNHGEQAIGTLQVGEQVWSYNPQTKQMELEPIQKIWLNHDNDLVDVTLVAPTQNAHGKATCTKDTHGKTAKKGAPNKATCTKDEQEQTTEKKEVIHTNEKHPFLTKEKGFIPVSQLKPGMHVLEADGRYGVVAKLVVVPGAMWMYNLTVAQDHTYAVGLDQWIVHNTGLDGCESSNPGNKTGANREAYVRKNLNGIFGTDMGTITDGGSNTPISTPLGSTDVDITTTNSCVEVCGPAHFSDSARISSFYNKMQKFMNFASDSGKTPSVAYDATDTPLASNVAKKLLGWKIRLAQFIMRD